MHGNCEHTSNTVLESGKVQKRKDDMYYIQS